MYEERKNSVLGIISTAIGIVTGASIFTLFIVAGYLEISTPGGVKEDSPILVVVGLVAIGMMLMLLIEIILGVVGIFQSNKKKIFSVLGLIINLMILLGTIAAVIIGNMMK